MISNMLEAEDLCKIRVSTFMRDYGYLGFKSTKQWQDGEGRPVFSVSFLVDFDSKPFESNSKVPSKFQIFHLTPENGQAKEIEYTIELTNTACHFGGNRYWFRCPVWNNGVPCKRRVGVLYFNGRFFGCRHCLNVTYASKSMSSTTRTALIFWQAQDYQEEHVKRYTWRGKPTRKMRRLQKMYTKIGASGYTDMLLRHYARGKNVDLEGA